MGLFGDIPKLLDTKGKTVSEIKELINRRRLQCLVHRYLYYVLAQPMISDIKYDQFERDLKQLVKQYPEIERKVPYTESCPSRNVGSSNPDDYTRHIEGIALSLLAHRKEVE